MATWLPVPDTQYEASDEGEIRIVGKNRCVKGNASNRGYLVMGIRYKGIYKTMNIHFLIALAFHGPRPEGHYIDHVNGVKTDNRPTNLEYVTVQESYDRAGKLGLRARGKQANAKLTPDDIRAIRVLLKDPKANQRLIAEQFGVKRQCISSIKVGRLWSWLDRETE